MGKWGPRRLESPIQVPLGQVPSDGAVRFFRAVCNHHVSSSPRVTTSHSIRSESRVRFDSRPTRALASSFNQIPHPPAKPTPITPCQSPPIHAKVAKPKHVRYQIVARPEPNRVTRFLCAPSPSSIPATAKESTSGSPHSPRGSPNPVATKAGAPSPSSRKNEGIRERGGVAGSRRRTRIRLGKVRMGLPKSSPAETKAGLGLGHPQRKQKRTKRPT